MSDQVGRLRVLASLPKLAEFAGDRIAARFCFVNGEGDYATQFYGCLGFLLADDWHRCHGRRLAPHVDFARILLGPKNDVVGVLKSEGGEYRIFDLRTRQERMIPQEKALKIDRNLTDEQTINYVGLPAVLAYRIKERSSVANQKGQTMGKVAQVSATATYVTLGTKDGIHVGQKVGVFRPGVEIKDPDSGVVLGASDRRSPSWKSLKCRTRFPRGVW